MPAYGESGDAERCGVTAFINMVSRETFVSTAAQAAFAGAPQFSGEYLHRRAREGLEGYSCCCPVPAWDGWGRVKQSFVILLASQGRSRSADYY